MNSVSALVMASDEEDMLPGCLKLLSWVDEIIVLVDDRSTDGTARIAEVFGARVSVEPWRGFAGQRERLASLATSDWLFYVDADERVTQDLADEALNAIRYDIHDMYSVPRLNVFLGRPMTAGGWWPDAQPRLIRKSALVRWEGSIHEKPVTDGSTRRLTNPIVHLGHRDVYSMLTKTASWSGIEGQRLAGRNSRPVRVRTIVRAAQREFTYRLLREAGWRDGIEGWIEAFYQSFSRFISTARAWELQRSESLADTYRRLDVHLQSGKSMADFRSVR